MCAAYLTIGSPQRTRPKRPNNKTTRLNLNDYSSYISSHTGEPPPSIATMCGQCGLQAPVDAEVVNKMLDAISQSVVPLTDAATLQGHRVFGAVILRKSDLSVVVAGTNEGGDCCLWHGEVSAIRNYYRLPAEGRPPAKDCYFVSTHEPCPLCLSAITWAGYDNIFFLHTYEDSSETFGMPVDLQILEEVFGIKNGEYRKRNKFWSAYAIEDVISTFPEEARTQAVSKVESIKDVYLRLGKQHEENAMKVDVAL